VLYFIIYIVFVALLRSAVSFCRPHAPLCFTFSSTETARIGTGGRIPEFLRQVVATRQQRAPRQVRDPVRRPVLYEVEHPPDEAVRGGRQDRLQDPGHAAYRRGGVMVVMMVMMMRQQRVAAGGTAPVGRGD